MKNFASASPTGILPHYCVCVGTLISIVAQGDKWTWNRYSICGPRIGQVNRHSENFSVRALEPLLSNSLSVLIIGSSRRHTWGMIVVLWHDRHDGRRHNWGMIGEKGGLVEWTTVAVLQPRNSQSGETRP